MNDSKQISLLKFQIELRSNMLRVLEKQYDADWDFLDVRRTQIEDLKALLKNEKQQLEDLEMENGLGDALAQQEMEMDIQNHL